MVLWNSPYYHNLDRGYYPPGEARDEPLGVEVEDLPEIYPELTEPYVTEEDGGPISIKDIGQGVPMGIAAQNIPGVDAKLRSGTVNLEIQFPGTVRGNRQAQTPGQFGHQQRETFKEIARARDVTFTTHAAFGIMGLAGQDQQGNYSKEQRKLGIDEVKRAIDFAADAAEGGSVVVHTGEFQRPLSELLTPDEEWRNLDNSNNGNPMFKSYDEEAERAGLVARVVPLDQLMDEALKAATKIAGMSLPATMMVKESINQSQEMPLAQGVLFERRTFHSAFATEDQKEGMTAFIEKRAPEWKHR